MAVKHEIDAILVLTDLEKNGYTTADDIAERTGLSVTEIRRYMFSEVPEYWTWEKLMGLRETNRDYYMHIVSTCKPMQNKWGCQINSSKFQYMIFYANLYGFQIIKTRDYPYIYVVKRPN